MAVENGDDIRLIVKIAQLYYDQEMTQAQIARELGIYRTTISRLLKRGRELGLVTIAINYNYNDNLWLEQQLKQKFALKEAVVVPCQQEQEEEQLAIMVYMAHSYWNDYWSQAISSGFPRDVRYGRWLRGYRQPASHISIFVYLLSGTFGKTGKPLPCEHPYLRCCCKTER